MIEVTVSEKGMRLEAIDSFRVLFKGDLFYIQKGGSFNIVGAQPLLPVTLSEADYTTMQRADLLLDGAIARVLNQNGHANWTCCPRCRVDDFTHVEGCALGQHQQNLEMFREILQRMERP